MKNRIAFWTTAWFAFSLLHTSCKQMINSSAELNELLYVSGSDYVREQNFGNELFFRIRFLPPELLALNDVEKLGLGVASYDSLLHVYQNALYFMLTIEHIGPKGNADVMMLGITNETEYEQRFLDMNFALDEAISIANDGSNIYPVFTHLENTYGIKKSRDILIAFPNISEDELDRMDALDILFEDYVYETGRYHFVFDKDILKGTSKFNIDL